MTGDAIRTRLRARPIALPIRCERPSPLPGVNHGRTWSVPTGTGRGATNPLRSTAPVSHSSSKFSVNRAASSRDSAITITFS